MNATPHDFTKPVRLPPDWRQRLNGWYQTACALANRSWAKQLLNPIEIILGTLETAYAQEALSLVPANSVGYRVMIAGGKLPTLLVLPRSLVCNIIAAMLGDTAAAAGDRELTLVEENLADYFLVQLWLPFFRESWPAARLVAWELQQREPNPQCSRFFAADDVLLALRWQIKGSWGVSEGVWLFQKKGILETLAEENAAVVEQLDEKTIALRKQATVGSLPVLVEFVLGTTELKLSELSHLQVGDVVLLDQGKEEGLIAHAGGRNLFRGRVGRIGSWKAFRVESSLGK